MNATQKEQRSLARQLGMVQKLIMNIIMISLTQTKQQIYILQVMMMLKTELEVLMSIPYNRISLTQYNLNCLINIMSDPKNEIATIHQLKFNLNEMRRKNMQNDGFFNIAQSQDVKTVILMLKIMIKFLIIDMTRISIFFLSFNSHY